jgi:hypothetical protein
MILLTCSVSRLSSAAIIASIVRTASVLRSAVLASACWASVCTACSTALFASSVFGLNSFFSSARSRCLRASRRRAPSLVFPFQPSG